MLSIITFFPTWLYTLLLAVGLISAVVSQILNIRYVNILAIILICLSAYSWGVSQEYDAFKLKSSEFVAKIETLEEISKNQNVEIKDRVVTKIKYIKEVINENKQQTQEISKQLDGNCKLTDAAVMLHDAASQNEVSRSSPGADARSSETKASDLLQTVEENYGTYYEVVAKLKAWQEWYKRNQELYKLAK